MLTKKQIENLLIFDFKTETPKRKWERKLLVAKTKEEKEKCRYFIKKHS